MECSIPGEDSTCMGSEKNGEEMSYPKNGGSHDSSADLHDTNT